MSIEPETLVCRAMARPRRVWTQQERERRRLQREALVLRRAWRRERHAWLRIGCAAVTLIAIGVVW